MPDGTVMLLAGVVFVSVVGNVVAAEPSGVLEYKDHRARCTAPREGMGPMPMKSPAIILLT